MVTKEQMNEVLRQLAAIYPAWQQAIKTQDHADNLKRVWWDEFNRLGMEPDDLKRGVIKARSSDSAFLPSLGQFIGWCSGSQHPTPHQAYQQAALGQYTSPEALEAAKRTGEFDLKNNPSRDIRRLFEDHYRDVLDEKSEGKVFELPKPKPKPQAIEYTSEVTQDESDTQAKGRATFAALRAIMTQKAEENTNVDTNLES